MTDNEKYYQCPNIDVPIHDICQYISTPFIILVTEHEGLPCITRISKEEYDGVINVLERSEKDKKIGVSGVHHAILNLPEMPLKTLHFDTYESKKKPYLENRYRYPKKKGKR